MYDLNMLHFQKLDLNGLKELVSWAQSEGWNPGINDAGIFYATDPDGFWGYYDNGKLIAGGSIVSYDVNFGFMGFFIVHPDRRASGIGRKLWYQRRDKLLSRLKPGAPIGMDGVVAMQPFYHKGGFEIAFRDERYERISESFEVDRHISAINDNDIDTVLNYDEACFGYSRRQFMTLWISQPGAKTFKYMDNGTLKGFAILRKADKGYKICPLFADSDSIAEELYKACLNAVVSEPVYIDIPVVNPGAVRLVHKYGAKYVFECARMYYGPAPENEMSKVFGITTFELG